MRGAYYEALRIVNENLRTSPRFFWGSWLTPSATAPQCLVVFSLDTTAFSRQNSPRRLHCSRVSPGQMVFNGFFSTGALHRDGPPGAQQIFRSREFYRREKSDLSFADSEGAKCNICPVSPCSASIRSAKRAASGCAPISPFSLPTTATAPAAAIFYATFPRRLARASACALAPSLPARHFDRVRADPVFIFRAIL
jgi:hypothetical protein